MKPLLELDCAAILRYMSFASSSEMALSVGVAPARLSVVRDSSIITWLSSIPPSYLTEAVAYYFPKIILLTCDNKKASKSSHLPRHYTSLGRDWEEWQAVLAREGPTLRNCATLTHLYVEELSLKFYLRSTSTGGFSRGFVIACRGHGLILLLLVAREVIPVILFEILRR